MAIIDMKVVASLLILTISVIKAEKNGVPVVIWGNNVPYLPPAYAGHTTSQKEFTQNYIKEMIKPAHNVVAFIQDKLSVEDFTQTADVYDENSNGGIMDNLKGMVENLPSVHLPSVLEAASALDSLMQTFDGKVHKLSAPYSIRDLELDSNSANLILVNLPPTTGSSEEQWNAFDKIDGIIGSVVGFLKQQTVPYLAFYTAERPSRVIQEEDNYLGRHLLATAEDNNATVYNNSCLLFYMKKLSLVLTPPKEEGKDVKTRVFDLPVLNSDDIKVDCTDGSVVLDYNGSTPGLNASVFNFLTLSMVLKNGKGYWDVSSMSLQYSVNVDGEKVEGDKKMHINIYAPKDFSYHCSDLRTRTKQNVSAEKSESPDESPEFTPSLKFTEMQLQWSNSTLTKFGYASDCVGFFDATIWMGIVCTVVLGLILAFGLCMLSSIVTMDRFDDPKGKTITVNVNE